MWEIETSKKMEEGLIQLVDGGGLLILRGRWRGFLKILSSHG